MRNIKLILEYDGSRYDGWQKQKGGKGQTIQDKIEEVISIFIHGDDFWPHMARIIVGTLMETGYGNMEPAQIPVIIESLDREKAGPTAEARGLFLQEVLYAE
ncbi:MAG: hypothetical protein ACOCNL_03840 [Acetivibrio ethanolgignens]